MIKMAIMHVGRVCAQTQPMPDRWVGTLFLYLQVLDALTTLVFVKLGVREANPILSFLCSSVGYERGMAAKVLASMLVFVIAYSYGRIGLIKKANGFFAVLVAWNLLVILTSVTRP